MFVGKRDVPVTAPARVSPATRAARADLYGDAFNEAAFMRPGQYLTRWLLYFDNRGVYRVYAASLDRAWATRSV